MAVYPTSPRAANRTRRIYLGDGAFVDLPEDFHNLRNRLNPDGAILGHGACLAGENTGWTFEKSAAKTCCPDYYFKALTAQEAHMLYGLPYVSDIVAGKVTVGFCAKPALP